MAKCSAENCKAKAVLLVGDCKYCKSSYCGKHRLPEYHSCRGMETCRKEANEKNAENVRSNAMPTAKMEKV